MSTSKYPHQQRRSTSSLSEEMLIRYVRAEKGNTIKMFLKKKMYKKKETAFEKDKVERV